MKRLVISLQGVDLESRWSFVVEVAAAPEGASEIEAQAVLRACLAGEAYNHALITWMRE